MLGVIHRFRTENYDLGSTINLENKQTTTTNNQTKKKGGGGEKKERRKQNKTHETKQKQNKTTKQKTKNRKRLRLLTGEGSEHRTKSSESVLCTVSLQYLPFSHKARIRVSCCIWPCIYPLQRSAEGPVPQASQVHWTDKRADRKAEKQTSRRRIDKRADRKAEKQSADRQTSRGQTS